MIVGIGLRIISEYSGIDGIAVFVFPRLPEKM
jgi:hypothetical protein